MVPECSPICWHIISKYPEGSIVRNVLLIYLLLTWYWSHKGNGWITTFKYPGIWVKNIQTFFIDITCCKVDTGVVKRQCYSYTSASTISCWSFGDCAWWRDLYYLRDMHIALHLADREGNINVEPFSYLGIMTTIKKSINHFLNQSLRSLHAPYSVMMKIC